MKCNAFQCMRRQNSIWACVRRKT